MSADNAKPHGTTRHYQFYSINSEHQPLLSVNAGVGYIEALEQASCFLSSAIHTTETIAMENNDQPALCCSVTLLEITHGIIESVLQGLLQEKKQ